MDHANTLRRFGLFDAKVPRYTSYPPANRFEPDVGAQNQGNWLRAVPQDKPVSVYVHVPFCRRLCWFCACRTQGTKTLAPVEAYLDVLFREIDLVAGALGEARPPMARLHLGGGTPTLLSGDMMTRLIDRIDAVFARSPEFEFSVEIDPTEAAQDVLDALAEKGMTRASVGVQDFDPRVQKAIGREQGFGVTQDVITRLRRNGVRSLNVDLLYGLPYQTSLGLLATLKQVVTLSPDRLALYGYAHVPHMSKRQVMIPSVALPDPERRYKMSAIARDQLVTWGFDALGIDHFARPGDSLAVAARNGRMKRNFQGYTDDPCDTLIGLGASAISSFPQGYSQNAVPTSAYNQRIGAGGLAGHKGLVLSGQDRFVRALISSLMCDGAIDPRHMAETYPSFTGDLRARLLDLDRTFPGALERTGGQLRLRPGLEPLARLLAARLDTSGTRPGIHSLAV
ncbi:oxygen-independent coproporphyrinogen III oxidase [Pseudaestuariivita atlantica]|uniref:Coproporphyrinogen-III oxidase n=1 Tax=Pseudaestuariivita atlantica TaxID=1317121 RepID=A0A0L1JTZ3_9RHOB|nr:oxygen-independent coproporphyrinogen III oxidase [Pseudaestuariivita atlantica]KNG95244.1 coproporphyrinogen III oxidase [Pseudaestuariivita atlantica]